MNVKRRALFLLLSVLVILGLVSAVKTNRGLTAEVTSIQLYSERYGVSESEAIRRMELQFALAQVGALVTEREQDAIGGIWFVHEPDLRQVVAVKRDEARVRAYYEEAQLAAYVEIVEADLSLAELTTLLERVNALGRHFKTRHNTALIQSRQVIEVRTVSRADFAQEWARAVAALDLYERWLIENPLSIVEDPALEALQLTADVAAGHAINDCTSGWNVKRYGQKLASTAGHCYDAQYYDGYWLGNVVWQHDPAPMGNYRTDLQLHDAMAQGHSLSNDFEWNQTVVAQMSKWGTEGAWVCKIGMTTAVTCGNIETVQANWNQGHPNNLVQVVRHSSPHPLSCGGDSGGPVYSWQPYGFAAHGWVMGGACEGYASNYMLVVPVNEAWVDGIHVITSSN